MYLDGMVEMARINKKVKIFIVKMLAEFETPTEAAKAVKEISNVEVTPQQCECQSTLLSNRLVIFDQGRK